MEIKDKIALVTGSTRGIGKAIVERLAVERAIVYLNSCNSSTHGRELEAELRRNGFRAFYLNGDISSEEDVKRIFGVIKDDQGRLDILVNNAGIYCKADLRTLNYRAYEAIHKVNGYGVYLCSFYASQLMDKGKIINISSIYGIEPNPNSILASGVKAEVECFTKAFAKRFKGRIEVNAVAPGYTDTPLLQESLSSEVIGDVIGQTPQKRLIDPREIADTVLFLIRSDGITGQTIVVDAGYTL